MSYEPLHHKYRPQTFADLVGQEAIASTLTNAINRERIAPAYLLTGPRGTGKTSSARILAKSLNCLHSPQPTPTPCGECEVCRAIARGSALDVIEIDAASNTGVDNIRELIERAQFAPLQCRYKVYVVDECHMLSVSAFNALLKTLEEPPNRVVFILATTDPQRVLPTIISRCQRFDYRRIPLDAMAKHLQKIADKEQIDIVPEAILLVAQMAQGGLRDAESLLDQLSLLSDTITVERVWDLVGSVPEQDLLALLQAIHRNQAEAVLDCSRQLMERGREPLVVLQNLASFYLNLLIAKTAAQRSDLVTVTGATWQQLCTEAQDWELHQILQGQQHLKESESQLKNTSQPRLWLEITLLGLLPSAQVRIEPQNSDSTFRSDLQSSPKISSQPSEKVTQKHTDNYPEITIPDSRVTKSPPANLVEQSNSEDTNSTIDTPGQSDIWYQVIEYLHPTTQSIFKSHCHLISVDGSVAQVGVKNQPLLKIAQSKVANLEKAFEAFFQHKVIVKLQVAQPSLNPEPNSSTVIEKKSSETILNSPYPEIKPESKQNNSDTSVPNSVTLEKVNIPPEISAPIPSSEKNGHQKVNYSAQEVTQAAESLAKFFAGEIIILDKQLDEDDLEEIEESQETRISNTPETQVSSVENIPEETSQPILETNPQPLIRNRPQLENSENSDDIPF